MSSLLPGVEIHKAEGKPQWLTIIIQASCSCGYNKMPFQWYNAALMCIIFISTDTRHGSTNTYLNSGGTFSSPTFPSRVSFGPCHLGGRLSPSLSRISLGSRFLTPPRPLSLCLGGGAFSEEKNYNCQQPRMITIKLLVLTTCTYILTLLVAIWIKNAHWLSKNAYWLSQRTV